MSTSIALTSSSTCCRAAQEAILGATSSAIPRLCLVGPPNAFGRVVLHYRDTSQRVFGGRQFYRNEPVDPYEAHELESIQRFVAELEGLR